MSVTELRTNTVAPALDQLLVAIRTVADNMDIQNPLVGKLDVRNLTYTPYLNCPTYLSQFAQFSCSALSR